jgi:hypothetical protein
MVYIKLLLAAQWQLCNTLLQLLQALLADEEGRKDDVASKVEAGILSWRQSKHEGAFRTSIILHLPAFQRGTTAQNCKGRQRVWQSWQMLLWRCEGIPTAVTRTPERSLRCVLRR